MSNIQKRLSDLQPYVTGIRFVETFPIVDVVFKDNWTIPVSQIISKEKSDQNTNSYFFYSEKEGVGFDELLNYVDEIIKINQERELKQELLKVKVEELKILFKDNNLEKLMNLKFTLGSSDIVSDLIAEEIKIEVDLPKEIPIPPVIQPIIDVKPKVEQVNEPMRVQPNNSIVKRHRLGEVELPIKGKKIELEDHSIPARLTEGECNCGPNESCVKCIDSKTL